MPTGIYCREPIKDRLLKKIIKTKKCWIWIGATSHGYGRIGYKNKTYAAHRVMWEQTYGSIKNGLWVLHKCDNRKCINPDHLFLGDRQDNVDDCVNKRRHIFGSNSSLSKLKNTDILRIKSLSDMGIRQHIIAKKFGITQSNVSKIINKKSWVIL